MKKTGFRKFGLLAVAMVSILMLGLFFFNKYYSLTILPIQNNNKSDVQQDSDWAYEVRVAPEALAVVRGPGIVFEIEQLLELRKLFETERFEDLNKALEKYQDLFDSDHAYDHQLLSAYRCLSIQHEFYGALFLKWIEQTPDAYQPYLAAAGYFYARAWKMGGNNYAAETPGENLEVMEFYFSSTLDFLKYALEIRADLLVAYCTLLGIYNSNGDNAAEDIVISESLNNFPDSFALYDKVSWAKRPCWGGSYVQMEQLAKSAEVYWDQTPELTALYGLIYVEQGRYASENKEYEKAVSLFEKALSYGDHWSFYYELARIHHYNLHKYDLALYYLNQCIALRPSFHKPYRLRSGILFAKQDYPGAVKDLKISEQIDPIDSDTRKWREWSSENLLKKGHGVFQKNLNAAIGYYENAIEFNDQNDEAFYWMGIAFQRLKKVDAAIASFKKTLRINPGHFDACKMTDYHLAQLGQWDSIKTYWDSFLAVNPEHAGAYFERSDASYQRNDREGAMSDLRKACELGHEKACSKYNSFQKRL